MSKRGREDGHVSKEDYDLDGGADRLPVSLAASVSIALLFPSFFPRNYTPLTHLFPPSF